MHRTMKEETAMPPRADRRVRQRTMAEFRREYNEERPHQALDMRTPSACYAPSPRPYPARVREPEYGGALAVRKVRECGVFTWKHENVFLSKTLSGERVGLLPIDERYYRVYFAAFPLARFDSWKRRIETPPPEDREQEQRAEPE